MYIIDIRISPNLYNKVIWKLIIVERYLVPVGVFEAITDQETAPQWQPPSWVTRCDAWSLFSIAKLRPK